MNSEKCYLLWRRLCESPAYQREIQIVARAVGSARNVWFKDGVETKWHRVMDRKNRP